MYIGKNRIDLGPRLHGNGSKTIQTDTVNGGLNSTQDQGYPYPSESAIRTVLGSLLKMDALVQHKKAAKFLAY